MMYMTRLKLQGEGSYFVLFGLLIVSTTTLSVWFLAYARLTNLPVMASRPTVMVVTRFDLFVDRLALLP